MPTIVQQMMRDPHVATMKDSRVLRYLQTVITSEHGITIPLSAARKVIAAIDERFTQKCRTID